MDELLAFRLPRFKRMTIFGKKSDEFCHPPAPSIRRCACNHWKSGKIDPSSTPGMDVE
jgi:hypothetical protein